MSPESVDPPPASPPESAEELERRIKEREERMRELNERLERSERAERIERSEKRRDLLKVTAIGVAAILIIAGAVYAFNLLPGGPRTGHEHYVFRIYNETEEIKFDDPWFDFSRTKAVRAHMHFSGPESTNAQYVIHSESRLGINLRYFFNTIDVELGPDHVELDGHIHNDARWDDNDTHAWQLWVDGCRDGPDQWVKQERLGSYHPDQHDRMLIVYAPRTANETTLAVQMTSVPTHDQLSQQLRDEC